MKCPHCTTAFHWSPHSVPLPQDTDGPWTAHCAVCPECSRLVVVLAKGGLSKREGLIPAKQFVAYPKGTAPRSAPPEVGDPYAQDYREASVVLADSPQASAALSRRCLQQVLRDQAGVKKSDLSNEIQEVLDAHTLPSYLAGAIDAVRNIGNFAAHPQKSLTSGAILPVEPGEAEWNLDVLDGLFDFYFVQPVVLKKRRDALNAKLAEAGKPPMK